MKRRLFLATAVLIILTIGFATSANATTWPGPVLTGVQVWRDSPDSWIVRWDPFAQQEVYVANGDTYATDPTTPNPPTTRSNIEINLSLEMGYGGVQLPDPGGNSVEIYDDPDYPIIHCSVWPEDNSNQFGPPIYFLIDSAGPSPADFAQVDYSSGLSVSWTDTDTADAVYVTMSDTTLPSGTAPTSDALPGNTDHYDFGAVDPGTSGWIHIWRGKDVGGTMHFNGPVEVPFTVPSAAVYPPNLAVHAAPTANSSGWNNTDVVFSAEASASTLNHPVIPLSHIEYVLSGAGVTSGVFATYTGPVTVSAEGTTTFEADAIDTQDNASEDEFVTVKIDKTAPTTDDDHFPSYVSSAVIHFVANDAFSGVASTNWALDGVSGTGTTVSTNGIGQHTLDYASTDVAGNKEPTHTVTFTVTAPAPTVVSTKLTLTSASSVKRKKTLTATVIVNPRTAGGKVSVVFYRYYSRKWHKIKSASVNLSGGKASYGYKPTTKGSWKFTVTYGGQTTATTIYKASSATRTFKVK